MNKGLEEGYSPLVKIFRLAAYKRACSHCGSVTLEEKQHSVVFLHSRAASLRALRLYAAYRQGRCILPGEQIKLTLVQSVTIAANYTASGNTPFCDSESRRGAFESL